MSCKEQDVVKLLDDIKAAEEHQIDAFIERLRDLSQDDARKLAKEIPLGVAFNEFGPIADILCKAFCFWNRNDHIAYTVMISEWESPEEKLYGLFLSGRYRCERAKQGWRHLNP